jgi:hypothetical protein
MIEEEEDKLKQRDRDDLFTNDETGRRCKTGDWRSFVGNEEHCDLFDGGNGNCCDKWRLL